MAKCVVEELRVEEASVLDQVIELLEEEHEPNPQGCAACRALALLRDGPESVLYRPETTSNGSV